jgi:hypothetical protein
LSQQKIEKRGLCAKGHSLSEGFEARQKARKKEYPDRSGQWKDGRLTQTEEDGSRTTVEAADRGTRSDRNVQEAVSKPYQTLCFAMAGDNR